MGQGDGAGDGSCVTGYLLAVASQGQKVFAESTVVITKGKS